MPGPYVFRQPHEFTSEPIVYAIGWSRQGPIKIGFTVRDPESRLTCLIGAHPYPKDLRVLAVWPGGRDLELRLHRHFADRRLRRSAEWFNVSVAEIATAIDSFQ